MEQVERPSVALQWWRRQGFSLAELVPSIADAAPERFAALDYLPRAAGEAGEAGEAGRGATVNRLAMLFFGEKEQVASAALKALRFSNADAAWIASLAGSRAVLGAGDRRNDPLRARRVRATCGAGSRGSVACVPRHSSSSMPHSGARVSRARRMRPRKRASHRSHGLPWRSRSATRSNSPTWPSMVRTCGKLVSRTGRAWGSYCMRCWSG